MTTLNPGAAASSAPALEPEAAPRACAELWTGYTLSFGIWSSAALIAMGYAMLLVHQGPVAPTPTSAVELLRLAAALDPVGVAWLGLLLLIATSFLRVLVAVVLFALERDKAHFLISAGVLGILLASLWLGKAD